MIRKQVVAASALGLALMPGAPATGMAAPPAPTHLALVIGNATYAHLPSLASCTSSANLVTASLTRAGFAVTERLDQTNGQMSGDLAALADAATHNPTASVVVYICGYAMSLDNRPFLLPVSATIEHDDDALTEGIVAKSVVDLVERSGAPGLVLLDAVAKPNATAKLSLTSLSNTGPAQKVAFIAATMSAVPPAGASDLATALSNLAATPNIEAGAAVRFLQQQMAGKPGVELSVRLPAGPEWLAGGPAIAPAPPPPPQGASVAPTRASFPDEAHMTEADRRQIQAALLHLGYYDGQVDGIFGADTRAAIRRFQHEIKAEMTGEITPAEAGRLLAEGH
jgi:hypothetical protein